MARYPHRRLVPFALFAAAALLLAACAPAADTGSHDSTTPVEGGTLSVTRSNPFEGFDLDKQTLNSSFQISQAVLEQLIRPGEDGASLTPGIASSWEFNDDNTALTIHVDPAASFSDGTPVTSTDVAFSVGVWQSGANYGATYAGITSTSIVDDHTIVLELAGPNTSMPAYLSWANAGIVPADFGGKTPEEFWQNPVGAGPFTVDKWSASGDVVLTKNPHYGVKGQPYLDQIVSSYAADPNSLPLRLRAGEIDVAEEIMPVTAASMPKELVVAQPKHMTPVLLMNTQRAALSDPTVRQAIGYAIDYDAISTTALKGYAAPPEGALPPGGANAAAPSAPYFHQDLAQAKKLLGSTSLPTLTLTYPNDASSTLMAQLIQSDLAEVGITVQLQAADSASSFATISSGDYDLGIYSYNAVSPDASDPAQYVAATATMFTGAPTDALWAMLGTYESAPTPAAKEAQITSIQDLLFSEAPFIALAHSSSLTGVAASVHGLTAMPWGVYDYSTVWKEK